MVGAAFLALWTARFLADLLQRPVAAVVLLDRILLAAEDAAAAAADAAGEASVEIVG